jgi:hypothetical protein
MQERPKTELEKVDEVFAKAFAKIAEERSNLLAIVEKKGEKVRHLVTEKREESAQQEEKIQKLALRRLAVLRVFVRELKKTQQKLRDEEIRKENAKSLLAQASVPSGSQVKPGRTFLSLFSNKPQQPSR